MKIISFNVNGIRAILSKDLKKDFDSLSSDVFVIEETKFSEDLHLDFPFTPEGYKVYWTVSKEKKGYSGVAILTKVEPLSVSYGLKDGKYDDEGRVITLEFPSFYLIGSYVPNSGEGLKRLSFRRQFNLDLEDYLSELDKKKPVILTGDLNVAHKEIDIKNPKANVANAGFTPEEREDFTRLLSKGFVDAYRKMYPDKVEYSWWSYRFKAREHNAGWRIDYFVISERLYSKVQAVSIHNEIMGSDHCPVELDIE
ncbi:MAG: exodeoxyribonuclease III [Bacilli bacterium]|jgi:exodeoxyribonuclease-3|nr:exodeoxyribonuclease III [Bacilli bacterium]MCI2055310.1 exodeoxyribonuclease III [Bacilli bacterium]